MTSASRIPVFTVREYSAPSVDFFGSRRSLLSIPSSPRTRSNQVGGVAAVQYTETFGQSNGGVVAAKRVMGNGVKGPARDSATMVGAPQCANTAHYLARRAAGEGQEQDSLRRDAALEKEIRLWP